MGTVKKIFKFSPYAPPLGGIWALYVQESAQKWCEILSRRDKLAND